jgi:hypothetical protein
MLLTPTIAILILWTPDYAKTQKALASCPYCYGEDDSLPKVAIIAMATRVYLACTLFEELVEGHCYIVPIQHHLSMLEADDDVWDEVRVSFGAFSSWCLSINTEFIEFYEMPDTNVFRAEPRRHLLRDSDQLEVSKAYRHRMCPGTFSPL